jgi:hypothetical protein
MKGLEIKVSQKESKIFLGGQAGTLLREDLRGSMTLFSALPNTTS